MCWWSIYSSFAEKNFRRRRISPMSNFTEKNFLSQPHPLTSSPSHNLIFILIPSHPHPHTPLSSSSHSPFRNFFRWKWTSAKFVFGEDGSYPGGRAVEIDCYDGDDGQPIVKHGHTLIKPCSFESIIRFIKPNLFKTSQYPVIIDLENHCSIEQQYEMARILQTILGGRILKIRTKIIQCTNQWWERM
jgi:hypothetical protein